MLESPVARTLNSGRRILFHECETGLSAENGPELRHRKKGFYN